MKYNIGNISNCCKTLEDLIQDAFLKILEGKRIWNKDKLEFEKFLLLAVLSEIRNYAKSQRPKFVPLENVDEDGEFDLIFEIKEDLHQEHLRENNQEEDEWYVLYNIFIDIIDEVKLELEEKDDIVALYVLEILLSRDIDEKEKTNQKIAEMLSVEVSEIVNAKKRLFRLIKNKMNR